jgi:hypothetical protein
MLPPLVENQIHAQQDQNIKERMLSPLVEHQIHIQEDQNIKERMLYPLWSIKFIFRKIRI